MGIQINFGVGSLVTTRTDISNATPTKFGVIQDVEIDFDFTNKDLIGQYQFPVDVARAAGKITGKAKTAEFNARAINDTFFGQNLSIASGVLFANNEAHSVPAPSGPYTVTVTNSANFIADQGVFYASSGLPLVHVASSPAQGQYSVSAGVYTFASADASTAILFNYTYSTTADNEISIANQLMGTSPVFSVLLANTYKGNVFNLVLNAAISTKMSFPFKNVDYTISDFEFSAYADASGNIGTITTSQ